MKGAWPVKQSRKAEMALQPLLRRTALGLGDSVIKAQAGHSASSIQSLSLPNSRITNQICLRESKSPTLTYTGFPFDNEGGGGDT